MRKLPRKPWTCLPALWLVAHCAVANIDCVPLDPVCNPAAGLLLYSYRSSATAPHNNAGILQWTRLHGIAGVQTSGHSVATDPAGNIFLAGFTDGNLGGQTLTGIRDLFLVKYEASGARLWTRLLGAVGADSWGFGIQIDSGGNIFITGGTAGNFDGQTRTGIYDVHLTKYDSGGVKQWTRLLGFAGVTTEGFALALDATGNAYTVGYTDGNLDGQSLTGTRDLFLIKYDTNGVRQWTRLFGVAGVITRAYAIAADTAGNLYVVGLTAGPLDGQTLTGTQDLFLIKYDTNGTRQWTRLLGDTGVITVGRAVAVNYAGQVYVTGYTDGNLAGETRTGNRDLFLSKYEANGTRLWTRLLGAVGSDSWGFALTADVLGNLYISGGTSGNLDGQALNGTYDMHVSKYDANGTKQWTRLLGATGVLTEANGAIIDAAGNLYSTGYTQGNLGGQTVTGTKDLFLNLYR